ncbi:MAG: GTPase HflX [Thermoanaerobaculia bacterium]|nr:GTPase HflX [Thermoanaerobaculia bacterium]
MTATTRGAGGVRGKERALLVGVSTRGVPRPIAEEHLDELERLVDTAGGVAVARFVKERSSPDPATYIGKGAVEQIGEAARAEGASLVVFDEELSPAQARNLEARWGDGIRVIDRPGLILDVFATHARTREARTQVELAQLQYLLPRLAGRYSHLSRLGAGIGTRGAGEQKLELDRRKIRTRIARLRRDLERIELAREVRRRGRRQLFQVAIVGYTNAGKTTLFNRLTAQTAYAADRLFATLDPRAARSTLPRMGEVIFVDTVGFVRKLPTSLVASFRSTLTEVRDADLVLHVLDATSPRLDEERHVSQEILQELGVEEGRVLPVWSKTDLAGSLGPAGAQRVSGKTGAGIPALTQAIAARLRPQSDELRLVIPYSEGAAIAAARARGRILEEKDLGESISLRVAMERKSLGQLEKFYVRESAATARARG